MDVLRVLAVILGLALLGVAGGMLYDAAVDDDAVTSGWSVVGDAAVWIGRSEDSFVYAGGDGVRAVDGGARVQWSAAGGAGSVRATVQGPAARGLLLGEREAVGELVLVSVLGPETDVRTGALVHGGTGFGEPRLPETDAVLAGRSRFDVLLNNEVLYRDLPGFWSVAQALRKDDGSIRNQGLVFNPLLRDRTIFADPDRLELTVLVYTGEDLAVLGHAVFRDVGVVPPVALR